MSDLLGFKRRAQIAEYKASARQSLSRARDSVLRESLQEQIYPDDISKSVSRLLFCTDEAGKLLRLSRTGRHFGIVDISQSEVTLVVLTHLINEARNAWRDCLEGVKTYVSDKASPDGSEESTRARFTANNVSYAVEAINDAGGWRVLSLAEKDFSEKWKAIIDTLQFPYRPPVEKCVPNLGSVVSGNVVDLSYLLVPGLGS